ncbi:unnamed protein product [Cylicostephanus goldi]|uniref:Reverse transcriptase domain-containing protein n=1 Tax=Cylicostephanus goldi TaxID=71465 RepID=A0A3P6QCU6_CYLGO|nr:unnamed protein product [Cylicostephanus goldi]
MKEVEPKLPGEQLALKKGIWGCTHAHILDQTIVRHAKKSKKELHMLWVDMTKAYDSISHQALLWCLRQWQLSPSIVNLLEKLIKCQKVRYFGKVANQQVSSKPLSVRNGLMQGDSLSPLLFVMVIAPVSYWIRNNIHPYEARTAPNTQSMRNDRLRLSHIFYMDDLKVYANCWEQLLKAKQGIEKVAAELGLAMNAAKCAIKSMNHLNRWMETAEEPHNVESSTDQSLRDEHRSPMHLPQEIGQIPVLGATGHYKYLGIEQNALADVHDLWQRTETAALETAREILASKLTIGEKIIGINTRVMPKIRYATSCIIFGKGKYLSMKKRAREFDLKMRQIMVETRLRFQYSCVARLYVRKELGGFGIKTAEEEVEHATTYAWCYLVTSPELSFSYRFAESLTKSDKRSLDSDFRSVLQANDLESRVGPTGEAHISVDGTEYRQARVAARAITRLIRNRWEKLYESEWRSKITASRVITPLNRTNADDEIAIRDSFLWLTTGTIVARTARNIVATQEAALLTRASPALSQSQQTVREQCIRELSLAKACRFGCERDETAEHVVAECDHWRSNLMIERHDAVARVVLKALKRKYSLEKKYQDDNNDIDVIDENNIVIYWNMPIITRDNIRHNKPDLVVWQKHRRKIWIIEFAVSWYVRIAEVEKIKLYKYGVNGTLPQDVHSEQYFQGLNLKDALRKERNCEVQVIPLVIGTCGECSPKLRKNIDLLELKEDTDQIITRMAKMAILGTDKIIRCHLST